MQRHRLSETLRPKHKTIKTFPLPTRHHHITEGLLCTAITFPQHIVSVCQEKDYKAYQNAETQFGETEQASEPDTAGMLG